MAPPRENEFPMRINKYLAHAGIATRTDADALIAAGRVRVNGRVAVLGEKVQYGDQVDVADSLRKKTYRYVAYNKPIGIVTHSPQGSETDIRAALAGVKGMTGLFPVGRLDKESHGLILLTDDGRVTDRLLNPTHAHEKEYLVQTKKPLRAGFKEAMEHGVDLGAFVTEPCAVTVKGAASFSIELHEGKRHQIRRMVDALHNEVADLKRVRIMRLALGSLQEGAARLLTAEERSALLADLGLAAPA
jgi:23S rRNA pseudouridine2604 synthase